MYLTSYCRGLSAQHSREEYRRLAQLALDTEPASKEDPWFDWMPFANLAEFVNTMGQVCSRQSSAFWRPTLRVSFMKALEVTFERLVPSSYFCVASSKPLRSEGGTLKDGERIELYHGTSLPAALQIMKNGFSSSIGTGEDVLEAALGMPCPGVYFAPTIACALGYPGNPNTDYIKGVPNLPSVVWG